MEAGAAPPAGDPGTVRQGHCHWGYQMTETELAEIEARVQAELATDVWSGEPDTSYDLLRDEMPRLLAEVRRLQAQVQVYRDGLSALESGIADDILDRALRVGRGRPVRHVATHSESQEAILEALETELNVGVKPRK